MGSTTVHKKTVLQRCLPIMRIISSIIAISLNLLLINSANAQKTDQLGNLVKTVGLIDNEDIYTPLQEKYIDSALIEFQKRLPIRIVIITGDTLQNDKLFWKVRRAWGYTDTQIENDIFIAMTSHGCKRIGFWDNWIYSIVSEDTVDKFIRNSWWPYFKTDLYFEALQNLLGALLPEIERNADKVNYNSCRH